MCLSVTITISLRIQWTSFHTVCAVQSSLTVHLTSCSWLLRVGNKIATPDELQYFFFFSFHWHGHMICNTEGSNRQPVSTGEETGQKPPYCQCPYIVVCFCSQLELGAYCWWTLLCQVCVQGVQCCKFPCKCCKFLGLFGWTNQSNQELKPLFA